MSNKRTSRKSCKGNKRTRKSLKGQWGKVGAPPKKTNWPSRPFTMATLFARNPGQCELSLRNKVDALVLVGTLLALAPIKQPHGNVGRPKSRFVLKDNFDPATMVLAPKKTKATVTVPVPVSSAPVNPVSAPAPVTAPASPSPVPLRMPPVISAPVASAPVTPPTSTEPAIG